MAMAVTDPHVYIGLTTIDARIGSVDRTLESLIAQDYRNFTIVLFISREPYLLDGGVKAVPVSVERIVQRDPRITIRWTPNIGPYRKLLPLLASLGERRALVATVDDDTIYPPGWLSKLVDLHAHYRCVIAYRAHQMVVDRGVIGPYLSWMRASINENPSLFLLPTGKDGVLYETSYFPPSVLNYVNARRLAPTADDIWFKWHTAMANVPVYCVSTNYKCDTFESTDDRPVSLFSKFNRDGGNDIIIKKISNWAKHEFNFDFVFSSTDGGHYRVGLY